MKHQTKATPVHTRADCYSVVADGATLEFTCQGCDYALPRAPHRNCGGWRPVDDDEARTLFEYPEPNDRFRAFYLESK